jgi:hypothetical protein
MRARPWCWLRTRLVGLLTKPPTFDAEGQPHFTTRIQVHMLAPSPAAGSKQSTG